MKKNILFRILARFGIIQRIAESNRKKNGTGSCPAALSGFDFDSSLQNPTEFYKTCVAFYDQNLQPHLKQHRNYFRQNQRGFGEDAFHVMWALLVERFQPARFLEIGVYRGQVLSLVAMLQKDKGITGLNTGIGPFERIGDAASVKDYAHCTDWLDDIKLNIAHFSLPEPVLIKALSTDPDAIRAIRETTWDMIYIDGNHDYEVVVEDWSNCAASVRVGGVIVLDDSGLDCGYRPPLYASGGFPGPSKVANSVGTGNFREILRVGHNRAFQRIR